MKIRINPKKLDDAQRLLDHVGSSRVGLSPERTVYAAGEVAERDRREMEALYEKKSRE